MQARVSASCQWGIVTAFGGREYVRYEWRNVSPGNEEAARKHHMLDVKDDAVIQKFEITETVTIVEDGTVSVNEAVGYSGLKIAELRALAQTAGIDGHNTMSRSRLITALEAK